MSMDVVGLYPSIPIREGVQAVVDMLQQYSQRIDMFGLSVSGVRNLLLFVLSHNYFRFGHQIYHQVDGVAMGNNLAPPFAILFMHTVEARLLQDSPLVPLLYKRYIDDILLLWTHGRESLMRFVQHFNSAHPSINFTYELSEVSGFINNMDITIMIQEGKLAYKLYQKACASGLLIDYTSAVPHHIKLAVASSQFLRAQRLSSNTRMRAESEAMVHEQLKLNNYPEKIIEEARTASIRPKRRRHANPCCAFLKLPYKSDKVHQAVNKAIRKYKIPVRVVYEHTGSLRRTLCRSALVPPLCIKAANPLQPKKRGRPKGPCISCISGGQDVYMQKNVVYQLKCKECPEQYVGETGRFLETRLEEHNGEARRQELDKPWGKHFRTTHPGCKLNYGQSAFSAVEVIGREPDRARRKLREAIEIRDSKPHVNISTGWDLL